MEKENGNQDKNFILAIGNIINLKEMDILNLHYQNIKDKLKMDINMEKEVNFSIMEIDTKVSILMESLKEMEHTFGATDLFIKANLRMVLDLAMEFGLTAYKNIKAHT